jgi:hypothetical protein
MTRKKLTAQEIAQIEHSEADSVRIDNGVQQVKAGLREIKAGLFGKKAKG